MNIPTTNLPKFEIIVTPENAFKLLTSLVTFCKEHKLICFLDNTFFDIKTMLIQNHIVCTDENNNILITINNQRETLFVNSLPIFEDVKPINFAVLTEDFIRNTEIQPTFSITYLENNNTDAKLKIITK